MAAMTKGNPVRILIFSGKRKSGKDFFTERLYNRLTPNTAVIIRLSSPIKCHWASVNGLDYNKLLDSSEYKESHRKEMLIWSEKVRNEDYSYFCRAAVEMSKAEDKPIWIISDARRKTDLKWFKETYGNAVKTFRIAADDETRKKRGWIFTQGIDDGETECGLDDVAEWDDVIVNNSVENIDLIIYKMVEDLNHSISGKPV